MFAYKIVEDIATVSRSKGFALKLNLISFNDKMPKYDLRRWDERSEDVVMGKGVTMTREELVALKELLNNIEL